MAGRKVHRTIANAFFPFNRRVIQKDWFNERFCWDNEFSRKIAEPLIGAGLIIAAIAEYRKYESTFAPKGKEVHTFQILLQGEMEVLLGNKHRIVHPGELACIPAGAPFHRKSLGPIWWLYLEFADNELWSPLRKRGPYVREYEHVGLLFANLRTILDVQVSGSEKGADLSNECARLILRILTEEMSAMAGSSFFHVVALQRLMEEVADEPQKDWKVDEMARRIGTSRSLFFSMFKNHFDVSPVEAVIRHRMRKAARGLRYTDKTVMDIAESSGYDSVASFTRLFTKHMGVSPGQYRKRYENDKNGRAEKTQ
jgi:AraC-like DNA-binding protein